MPEDPPLTGIVVAGAGDAFAIDLTGTALPPADGADVLASIFRPEALYRARATAHPETSDRVILDHVRDVERIQRRAFARRTIELEVSVRDADDHSNPGTVGKTVDIGVGGAHVMVKEKPAGNLLVTITMLDGVLVMVDACVVRCEQRDGAWSVRMAFQNLDDDGIDRISALVRA